MLGAYDFSQLFDGAIAVQITLVLFDTFKEEYTDRNYPGLYLEPIGRCPEPVCLFFFERVEQDRGSSDLVTLFSAVAQSVLHNLGRGNALFFAVTIWVVVKIGPLLGH